MNLLPPRPRPRRIARATAALAILVALGACSGGDDSAGDPVPTLLTTPLPSTSTSSTSTTSTTVAVGEVSTSTTLPSTAAESSTSSSSTAGDTGTPSGPGVPVETSGSTSTPASSGATDASTSSTGATSTTADIEPPPPSLASTVPISTAAQPPDTIGGADVDYLLGPRSIAGLQFGASRTTVLNRMRQLLGDPLRADTLPECPGGPGTALTWFNAAVIITDRGLAFYSVGVNLDDYANKPVPGWHTATLPLAGASRAQLDAAYPQQVTYAPPVDLYTPFSITAGADAGMSGRLEGDLVYSISAGTTAC